uniref:Uncharacterized protein n=1 Tax=Ammonifex degensii TaxID=42838 RepID=A0A7C2I035_9THEO
MYRPTTIIQQHGFFIKAARTPEGEIVPLVEHGGRLIPKGENPLLVWYAVDHTEQGLGGWYIGLPEVERAAREWGCEIVITAPGTAHLIRATRPDEAGRVLIEVECRPAVGRRYTTYQRRR